MFPAVAPSLAPVVDAVLTGLLDDAAMYPPAAAPMEAALGLHAAALASPWSTAVGQFLCPAAAVGQLANERALLGMTDRLRVGVVVGSPADPLGEAGGDLAANLERVGERDSQIVIEGIELRPTEVAAVGPAIDTALRLATPQVAQVAIEIIIRSVDEDAVVEQVAAVARARRSDARIIGKVRCGTVGPTGVPTATELAGFLKASAEADLPFKATAGLHHAIYSRGQQAANHGFLNLLAASDAAATSAVPQIESVLVSDAVRLGTSGLSAGDHEVPTDRIGQVRADGLRSFGTCSFTEPLSDLQRMMGGSDV